MRLSAATRAPGTSSGSRSLLVQRPARDLSEVVVVPPGAELGPALGVVRAGPLRNSLPSISATAHCQRRFTDEETEARRL